MSAASASEKYPPGYRFRPTETVLINEYLIKKCLNLPVPGDMINEVDLYEFHPADLMDAFTSGGRKKVGYFFSPRNRKYQNGNRPSRSTGNIGFWKATSKARPIYDKDQDGNKKIIGSRQALVYMEGNVRNAGKTDWIMHEFRIPEFERTADKNSKNNRDMKLDDWVLCKIYLNGKKVRNVGTTSCPTDSDTNGSIINTNAEANNSNLPNGEPLDMVAPAQASNGPLSYQCTSHMPFDQMGYSGNQDMGNLSLQQVPGYHDTIVLPDIATPPLTEFGHVGLPDLSESMYEQSNWSNQYLNPQLEPDWSTILDSPNNRMIPPFSHCFPCQGHPSSSPGNVHQQMGNNNHIQADSGFAATQFPASSQNAPDSFSHFLGTQIHPSTQNAPQSFWGFTMP